MRETAAEQLWRQGMEDVQAIAAVLRKELFGWDAAWEPGELRGAEPAASTGSSPAPADPSDHVAARLPTLPGEGFLPPLAAGGGAVPIGGEPNSFPPVAGSAVVQPGSGLLPTPDEPGEKPPLVFVPPQPFGPNIFVAPRWEPQEPELFPEQGGKIISDPLPELGDGIAAATRKEWKQYGYSWFKAVTEGRKPEKQHPMEGEIADLIERCHAPEEEFVEFVAQPIKVKGRDIIGEHDIVTKRYLLEIAQALVHEVDIENEVRKIKDRLTDKDRQPLLNPEKKPVFIYAPKMSDRAETAIIAAGGIPVTGVSYEQLVDYMERFTMPI